MILNYRCSVLDCPKWLSRTASVVLMFLGVVTTTVLAQTGMVAEPNGTQQQSPKPAITHLDDAFEQARTGNRDALPQLTAQVIGISSFRDAPLSIRTRLLAAESSYRGGSHAPITELALADAINQYAVEIGIPNYQPTTPEQLRAFRLKLMNLLPHLLSAKLTNGRVGLDEYSPLAAWTLTDIFLRQKLFNDQYQTSAAEWMNAEESRHGVSKPAPERAQTQKLRVAGGADFEGAAKVMGRMKANLWNDSSEAADRLRAFMDKAQF